MSGVQTYASIAGGKGKGKENVKQDQGSLQSKNDDSRGRHENGPPSSKRSHSQSEPQAQPQATNSQTPNVQTKSPKRGHDTSPTNKPKGAYTASEYTRSTYHTPQTQPNRKSPSPQNDTEDLYILTLLTTDPLHKYMTSLRQKYFPAHLNKLAAHISLFHALPGSKLSDPIIPDIESLCQRQRPFPITAEAPNSPRLTNILVPASSPHFAIEGLRKSLRLKWTDWLSRQDNGSFRPHWTVLNKVDEQAEVEQALERVKAEFEPCDGRVLGLVLWRYEKGFWKDRRVFEFQGR